MDSLCILPPEVICHIICSLCPLDVVRLRAYALQVSKQFYGLTYDIAIWRTLYSNARLPRPPGPFPSQSIQFFERTLVHSERVERSWKSQPMRDISNIPIPTPTSLEILSVILHGKWLVGCESSTKFVVFDLDSSIRSRPHQLLWESPSPIHAWDANSLVSANGLLIIIILRFAAEEVSWKLLEFRVSGDAIYHSHTLDVPKRNSDQVLYIDGGRSPFLYIHYQRLVFYAETRSFFNLPEFRSDLVEGPHANGEFHKVIMLTKTHIIALFPHAERAASQAIPFTLLQAFTVPSHPYPLHDDVSVLRLSHEGIAPGQIESLDLIQNSCIATSGTTNFRFLHQILEGDDLRFSCIDLSLPRHSPTDTVLPMTVELHDVAHVNHGRFSECLGRLCYVESSDDGHARGFWRFAMPYGPSGDFRPYPVMRFTIDASQQRCVAILGEISVPQWAQIYDPPWSKSVIFDCVRGTMFYDKIRYILGVDDYESAIVISMK